MILKPNSDINESGNLFTVFLAGSIEMGKAENWQETIENELEKFKDICIYNPRRDDWDSSWKQEITHPQFNQQVNWELDALEKSDMIVFYFSPETQSPITLLELGLFSKSGKLVVCCPQGFWRKGNVDIICKKFAIPQVDSIDELIIQIHNFKTNKQLFTV
jgi:hypothetical protein